MTAGYHRRLTHRAYIAPRWFDRVLTVLGMLADQGPPMFWVAYHRKHHAFGDENNILFRQGARTAIDKFFSQLRASEEKTLRDESVDRLGTSPAVETSCTGSRPPITKDRY